MEKKEIAFLLNCLTIRPLSKEDAHIHFLNHGAYLKQFGTYYCEFNRKYVSSDFVSVGIDPGINFGITVLNGFQSYIYYGKFIESSRETISKIVYDFTAELFGDRVELFNYPFLIEGAAYNAHYGQVKLESVRNSFLLGAMKAGFKNVSIVSPMAARKKVFGRGDIKASDVFADINKNAADSFIIALSGLLK